jgi:hypothetical protein
MKLALALMTVVVVEEAEALTEEADLGVRNATDEQNSDIPNHSQI